MQKTLFKKYLRITTGIILVSFLILSTAMIFSVSDYWRTDRRNILRKSADSVAAIAASSVVTVQSNQYRLDGARMQVFASSFARNIDSDIFITDSSGAPLLIAYGSGGDVDATRPVSPDIMSKALKGRYTSEDTMGGIYKTSHYVVGVPITVETAKGHAVIGAVFAAYDTASLSVFRQEIARNLILSAFAAFLIAFCVVWLFTLRLVKPLQKMAAAARAFGEGDFSVRVPATTSDEIGQLALAFNNMADSLASSESASRNFVANVSHELKTPMTTIAGFIDGILDGTIPPEKQKHYLGIVSGEVKRLSRLVRTMLNLSRIDSGSLQLRPARFDITNTVLVALLSFEQKIEERKIEVRGLEGAESIFVDADPDLIHQVVYNLIDNAVKFANEGGYIEISLAQDAQRTTVRVENSGQGVAPDELPLSFDRFYKTDKSRSQDKNGMGLGLYLVKTIIRQHGGAITATSVQNQFCRFEFWLPKKAEKPRPDSRRMVETTADPPAKPGNKPGNKEG